MNTYQKLLKYVPEKRHYAYISIFMSALASILAILPYWYFWKFLYALFVDQKEVNARLYAGFIIILMISYGIVYIGAVWVSHLLGFRLETNLRKEGIRHLMDASFAFFDTNSSGKIRKVIDDNAAATHSIVAHLIPDNAAVIVTPIGLILMNFLIDWRLGIYAILVVIAAVIAVTKMTGDKTFLKLYAQSMDNMNSEAVEYVRGMQVVKIFKGTLQSFKIFYQTIVDYSKFCIDYTYSCRLPYVIFQILLNIAPAILLPLVAVLLDRGESVPFLLAKLLYFTVVSGLFLVTFNKVMYVGQNSFMGAQAVDKLEALFVEMQKDKLETGELDQMENFEIEFDHVSFGYKDKNVLENLSFKLPQHQTYALVGASGSGKSTIAKLISGFYKINSGQLKIGGKEISAYSEKALEKHIAFVFQNAKLFKTSIFENVRMGDSQASAEAVMEALHQAKCDDILAKFEQKENTVIGSKGVDLSGGEIQRIAIARALLKDADIIILDEASAAADPENEYEIQQAFSNLIRNKTVIMIAHRLSSIRQADEILVVDNGQIVERGTDQKLMSFDSHYKKLQIAFNQANQWRVVQ